MSSIDIDDTQMELLLADVVETLDADGNGEVDLKEFVEGSLKVLRTNSVSKITIEVWRSTDSAFSLH